MATNPQAEGKTKITFQVDEADKELAKQLAKESDLSLSEYVREAFDSAIQSHRIYKRVPFEQKIAAETPANYLSPDQILAERLKPRSRSATSQARASGKSASA